jgi:Rrf2 family cysteine metabolism transcriptional repressor
MKLSTRARYGMRIMLTLAVHYGKGPMCLKDIAGAEEISEKYLSLLVIPLRHAGLIHSIRGAYGGYTLEKPFCMSPVRRVQKPRHLGLS